MTRGGDRPSAGPRLPRSPPGALVVLAAAALLSSGCGGRSAASALHDRLLSAADLPAGWSGAPTSGKSVPATDAPCLSGLPAHATGVTSASAGFVQGASIPAFGEGLTTGPRALQEWQRLDRALARCRTATMLVAGEKVRATVHGLSFPRVGSASSAYAWSFTLSGVRIGFDLVLFRVGTYEGHVVYADLGAPRVATAKAFVEAAVAKARTGATEPLPDTLTVASSPVRTIRTRSGTVAYRAIESGPPLLLVTGYSGTMEGWDRRFVDALARRHRVVIFDNAGVGRTQALPAPLGIDAMAEQTSALIDALGLGRPSVLGWSMGGMIAQALAVLHPGQVRRLILCATFPGDGTTTRPSRQAIDALKGSNPTAYLFPTDRTAARNTYLAAISSYPSAPPAPAATVAAQARAVDEWWAGHDPAGRRTGTIAVPTLVADGTLDRLDPVANSRALAALIPAARLRLYPDAGHAFLFQEQADFLPLIESFLG